jgi:hypothetical protein
MQLGSHLPPAFAVVQLICNLFICRRLEARSYGLESPGEGMR